MSYYIFDDGTLVTAVFAVFFGLMAWMYWTRRERMFLIAAMVALALMSVPAMLDWMVITPIEKVEERLDQLVDAAVHRDANTIVGALSPQFNEPQLPRAELERLIRSEFDNLRLTSVDLAGRKVSWEGDAVVARFVAHLYGGYRSYTLDNTAILRLLKLTFRNHGGEWRIVRIQRFGPIGERDEIPLQSH